MERRPFIAAYLYDGGGAVVTAEDARLLDRINYAFGLVVDGKISGAHWQRAGQLRALKAANPHLRTILSLGGWGAGGFSDACLTPAGREDLAQSAVKLMLGHDFDGVDLDWEYPTIDEAGIDARPDDKWTFTLLMRLLRAKLDALTLVTGRPYSLSMAVGCGTDRYARIMQLAELAEFLDEINLMSYDMRQGSRELTGHHANLLPPDGDNPISAKYSADLFMREGVPAEKLVLGAAFYGRGWSGVENTNNGLHAKSAAKEFRAGSYAKLAEGFIDKNGYARHWDDSAQAPWLYNGENFISYDDPRSVAAKMRYARDHGMKGVMYWEYGGDPTGALLRAMDEARR